MNRFSKYLKAAIFIFVIIIAGSCRHSANRADISEIKLNIDIQRFEEELFSVDPSSIEKYISVWQKKYGVFFNHYCQVLRLGDTNDPYFPERLRLFVTDFFNYQIYERTRQVFPNLENLNAQLTNAFKHYHYYFPEKSVPNIYTYISGFGQSAITDDSILAIGLDKYLGKDEKLYKQAGIYNYLLVNMHPAKIVSDCMNFWAETEFMFNDSIDNLATNMLYKGRLFYFSKMMLPDQPDSLIWGFSKAELKYLEMSEKSMWAYLIEHKLLFSTDKFIIDKFILEGPFTKDFGRNSPARAAIWMGYRIIESYVKRNPKITLNNLMNKTDYQEILNKSGYNP